jgi:transcriptional regulator with XRE-family HTH domain
MIRIHPQMKPLLALGGLLADAAEAGARRTQRGLTARRGRSGNVRRPGADTPMWNALAARLRDLTQKYGTQARLARYLGVPRQRLHNFLGGRSRLPDAELTLRLLHWQAEVEAGRDPAL